MHGLLQHQHVTVADALLKVLLMCFMFLQENTQNKQQQKDEKQKEDKKQKKDEVI